MSPKELIVKFGEGLKVDVEYKGFVVKTDQPVRDGGGGTAPAPFDYFLVSLAACAGFYALAFCRERKISTEGLAMTMAAEKGAASKLIDKVTIAVVLPNGFPEKYKFAVVKAIDHCTVKANILQAPQFEIVVRP
ncbi:MAG: osmotically inducible protein OsmC [Candidatus Aminicenantes bacterium RBG_16_63_14]|nr:MAG: osmotically inducible protein OsmC [Candidatus Aminicenantes bacterium RBG_16_63_14]OGD27307.1 MAG: osmotically inducible protein OsmC [Candidatus Aminicenantes bacterium RBG_19FT_COMBO_65_30]